MAYQYYQGPPAGPVYPPGTHIPQADPYPIPVAYYAPPPPTISVYLPPIPQPPSFPPPSHPGDFDESAASEAWVYFKQENRAHSPEDWKRFAMRFSGCGEDDLWLAIPSITMNQWIFFTDPIHVWRIMALYSHCDDPPNFCPPRAVNPPAAPAAGPSTSASTSTAAEPSTSTVNATLAPQKSSQSNNFSAFKGLVARHARWDHGRKACPQLTELVVEKIRFDYDLLGIVDCFAFDPWITEIAEIKWIEKSGRLSGGGRPFPADFKGSSHKIAIKLWNQQTCDRLTDPDPATNDFRNIFDPTFVRLNDLGTEKFEETCAWIEKHIGTIVQKLCLREKHPNPAGRDIVMTGVRMSEKKSADRLIELDWKNQHSEGSTDALRGVTATRYRALFKKDARFERLPFTVPGATTAGAAGAPVPPSYPHGVPVPAMILGPQPTPVYQHPYSGQSPQSVGGLTPQNGFLGSPYAGTPFIGSPYETGQANSSQAGSMMPPPTSAYTTVRQPYTNGERAPPRNGYKVSRGSGRPAPYEPRDRQANRDAWNGRRGSGASPPSGNWSPPDMRGGGRSPGATPSQSKPPNGPAADRYRGNYRERSDRRGAPVSPENHSFFGRDDPIEVDANARASGSGTQAEDKGRQHSQPVKDDPTPIVDLSRARKEKEEAYNRRVQEKYAAPQAGQPGKTSASPEAPSVSDNKVVDVDAMDIDPTPRTIPQVKPPAQAKSPIQQNNVPSPKPAAPLAQPPAPISLPPAPPSSLPPGASLPPKPKGGDPRVGMLAQRAKPVVPANPVASTSGSVRSTGAALSTTETMDAPEDRPELVRDTAAVTPGVENLRLDSGLSSGMSTEDADLLKNSWRGFSMSFLDSCPSLSAEQKAVLAVYAGKTPREAERLRGITAALLRYRLEYGLEGAKELTVASERIDMHDLGLAGVMKEIKERCG